jgi:uncharacterized membrane protein (DUF4010 family)
MAGKGLGGLLSSGIFGSSSSSAQPEEAVEAKEENESESMYQARFPFLLHDVFVCLDHLL